MATGFRIGKCRSLCTMLGKPVLFYTVFGNELHARTRTRIAYVGCTRQVFTVEYGWPVSMRLVIEELGHDRGRYREWETFAQIPEVAEV